MIPLETVRGIRECSCCYSGRSRYVAKVDFRRCMKHHSDNAKPNAVKVRRRVRRQAVSKKP